MPLPSPHTLSNEAQELIRSRLAGEAAPPKSNEVERTPRNKSSLVPLSPEQRRIWFLHELHPGRVDYNVAITWRLRGTVRIADLSSALTDLVARHDQLRIVVVVERGEPYQRVTELPAAVLAEYDLSADEDIERAATALARERRATPFDLETGPLHRFWTARLGPDDHLFGMVVHHAVVDRDSMAVLLEDVVALYEGVDGRATAPPGPGAYADYAAAQHQLPRGIASSPHWRYWLEQLNGVAAVLDLPTDRSRPRGAPSGEAGRARALITATTTAVVRALADACAATPFVVCLAAFEALLFRYTDAESFTVGCPFTGRDRRELERVVGFFARSLPLVARRRPAGDPSFRRLVLDAREAMLGAHEHQAIPLEDIVSFVDASRDPSHNPLFQVWFDYTACDPEAAPWPSSLVAEVFDADDHRTRFDLEMHVTEIADGLEVRLLYARELFDPETAEGVVRHYGHLLAAAVRAPEMTLAQLPMLDEDEIDLIVTSWAEADSRVGRLGEA